MLEQVVLNILCSVKQHLENGCKKKKKLFHRGANNFILKCL